MKIVRTSVRTAAWCSTHRQPSAISVRTGRRCDAGATGRTTRDTSRAPSPTSSACAANGTATPTTNSRAPRGGPASWFMVTKPVCSRALARARSWCATSIGSRVAEAVSAKTSAVPSRNSAASTTAIDTVSVARDSARTPSTPARTRSTTTTTRRRSTRSARAPACSPKTSQGSCCSRTASDTRNGSSVREATSSGPAAREIPSPRLEVQLEASSHRKPRPHAGGTSASRARVMPPR